MVVALPSHRRSDRSIMLESILSQVEPGTTFHADPAALIRWIGALESKSRPIKLVHGEGRARKVLAAKLGRMNFIGIE